MANGFYVLHSADPHLAAVGFVWNRLSSIVDLPLLALDSELAVDGRAMDRSEKSLRMEDKQCVNE
ncbi:MAG TPA: hypothetical protein VIC86_07940 [Acidimicrobiales bacterium]|jgi:hypothetical protein